MGTSTVPPIGDRIRAERLRRGLTVRGLARAVGVSPSLISQIETGKSQPSVSTLYAITNALGITVADLLDTGSDGINAEPARMATAALTAVLAANSMALPLALEQTSPTVETSGGRGGRTVTGPDRARAIGPVVDRANREIISLDSGVTWERLGQLPSAKVDFLLITYQPGGTSSSNGDLMRHTGTEYGYLLSGQLTLRLGFDEHRLVPGDAVCFASSTPHGYRNDADLPAVGVWWVLDQD